MTGSESTHAVLGAREDRPDMVGAFRRVGVLAGREAVKFAAREPARRQFISMNKSRAAHTTR